MESTGQKKRAKKSGWKQAPEARKRELLDDQNFRRALKAQKLKDTYKEQPPSQRKDWKRRFKQTKSFDFVQTKKRQSETDRTTSHKGYRWKTEQQVKQAEGWSLTNKCPQALKNAKALIAKAKAKTGHSKVISIFLSMLLY